MGRKSRENSSCTLEIFSFGAYTLKAAGLGDGQMHRLALFFIATGILLGTTVSVVGASIQLVQGAVSVNRGGGYQPVVDWVAASPGDLVMAGPNGSGKITYEDGCVVEVTPGAVVAVQEKSPCSTGATGVRPVYLLGGAAIVGGIVAGAIALSDGGGDMGWRG